MHHFFSIYRNLVSHENILKTFLTEVSVDICSNFLLDAKLLCRFAFLILSFRRSFSWISWSRVNLFYSQETIYLIRRSQHVLCIRTLADLSHSFLMNLSGFFLNFSADKWHFIQAHFLLLSVTWIAFLIVRCDFDQIFPRSIAVSRPSDKHTLDQGELEWGRNWLYHTFEISDLSWSEPNNEHASEKNNHVS